ncbi:MAG: hypothetical protein CVU57_01090 [Deltaproteobacteria bacterium HGW-Deltaproteobacteria-15]|jgi:hypothetical protein|nr:MAG: hypothetical protein CVU57_01090 [Deltaproteobacteria bacterium HGW-Deltaproteobacteria-15]
MGFSRHARRRGRQRGFSEETMDVIRRCGRVEKAPGGALRVFFGVKEYQRAVSEFKQAIHLLGRAKGGVMIIRDEEVITVYK